MHRVLSRERCSPDKAVACRKCKGPPTTLTGNRIVTSSYAAPVTACDRHSPKQVVYRASEGSDIRLRRTEERKRLTGHPAHCRQHPCACVGGGFFCVLPAK